MNAKAEQNQAVDLDALVKRCDDCKLDENDLYKEMEELEDGGRVNAWASALRQHPQLANRCNTFDKFRGYSICRLLEVQPQLVEKFDMEELCSSDGRYWQSDFDAWLDYSLKRLLVVQPSFVDEFLKNRYPEISAEADAVLHSSDSVCHTDSANANDDLGKEDLIDDSEFLQSAGEEPDEDRAKKGLPFPLEYSFCTLFRAIYDTPTDATYEDVLLAEVVKLIRDGKYETLNSFVEEGRYARFSQKSWGEVLLIICRMKCYHGFKDTEWIGGAPFRELCAAADWIEDMSPDCVRSAEDKYGNNALFYIYSAWLDSRSKSRGILDAFKGLMSVKEDVARFVRMGCNEEKKNSFGVSAQDLMSEMPKFALSLLCDSSCAVEDWCEGLKVLDCNNFICDSRLPLGSVIAIMTSDIVDEAWKIKTLSYIMERQLYGISFVPLEYDLGKCQTAADRDVDKTATDYPTEGDVLTLLRQSDIAELDRLGTDGRLKRHEGKWTSILLQLVLMANYDTAYSNGNRFLRKGVEWLERMSPGVIASALDKYENNVLVYLLCAMAETCPSYLARTDEGVEMAMADYEFLNRLGGDASRKNSFGVSATMLLPVFNEDPEE